MLTDTIFALSSGSPPAAIAVIRISGGRALAALAEFAGDVPPPRRASLRALHDADGMLLDNALVLVFPGPGSVTGEDLVELHLHGGYAVVAAVEAALTRIVGLRRAEPGEFTRRAFHNGKLDLAEAEGLADLLTAETESQRRNAMMLANGTVSRMIRQWMNGLTHVCAMIEARIDYADEDDVPDDDGQALALLRPIQAEMKALLAMPSAERLRDGIRVVIAGPPNSGKSTLINRLAGREVAIATSIAGTTRDLLEAPVSIAGRAFVLIDSAGLRETDDLVESIGVERARRAVETADMILWLGRSELAPPRCIRIANFADLHGVSENGEADIHISALTGEGIDALLNLLIDRTEKLIPGEGEVALLQKQRDSISLAYSLLDQVKAYRDIVVVVELLQSARSELARVIGEDSGIEAVLDSLFGRFCLGK